MSVKLNLFPNPSIETYVLGAQKNRLIETVLLITHNICFGREMKKIVFQNGLLSGLRLNVKLISERIQLQ